MTCSYATRQLALKAEVAEIGDRKPVGLFRRLDVTGFAADFSQPFFLRIVGGEEPADFFLYVVFDATDGGFAIRNKKVGGARIVVIRHADTAGVADRESADFADEGAMDVAIDDVEALSGP